MMKINYSPWIHRLPVLGIALLWASTLPLSGQSGPNNDSLIPSMQIPKTAVDGVIVPSDESSIRVEGAGSNPSSRRSEAIAAALQGRRAAPLSPLCFEPGMGWKERNAPSDAGGASLTTLAAGSGSSPTLSPTKAAYKTLPGGENSLCPQVSVPDTVRDANSAASLKVDDASAMSADHSTLANIQASRLRGYGAVADFGDQSSSPEMPSIGTPEPGYLSSLLARSRAQRRVSLSDASLPQGQFDDLSFQPGLGASTAGEGEKRKRRHDCANGAGLDHRPAGLFPAVQDSRCSPQTGDRRNSGSQQGNWLGKATF